MIFEEFLPDIKDYWTLFQTTGWNDKYCFDVGELEKSLQGTWYACSLYDEERLVGFGRVLSDGVFHAFIVDVIIHPDHQGQGLGRQLLERLLDKCNENNIRDIQLFSARDKYAFYEKLGFERRSLEAPGMHYKKQSRG